MAAFLFFLVAILSAFALGVLFSQKVKDKLKGVSADARAKLEEVERDALAKLRAAPAAVAARVAEAVAPAPAPAPAPVPAPAPAALLTVEPAAPAAVQ